MQKQSYSRFAHLTIRKRISAVMGTMIVLDVIAAIIIFLAFVALGNKKEELSASMRVLKEVYHCLLYTSPSPRDLSTSRMPASA